MKKEPGESSSTTASDLSTSSDPPEDEESDADVKLDLLGSLSVHFIDNDCFPGGS